MHPARPLRILAVASPGTRWAELQVVAAGFENAEICFASAGTPEILGVTARYRRFRDFSLYSLWNLPVCAAQLIGTALSMRPDIVVSTGAAPGLIAMIVGRLVGARCIWVESLTSVDDLSLSGKLAGFFANDWLTQWPHLSRPRGPHYKGAVL
ncbi:glucuronosyltransferase [Arsenicitalea aurantiaca]|nr:glucuronosyltransferase [Arsenicitalea aurantiaca]